MNLLGYQTPVSMNYSHLLNAEDLEKQTPRNANEKTRSGLYANGQGTAKNTHKRNVAGKGPVVDQSSSDSNKVLNISDILLQARDMKTAKSKVFVEWEGLPLEEASWIPLVNLQGLSAVVATFA